MKKINYLALLHIMALSFTVGGCTSPKVVGYESYKTYGEQVEDRKIINNIRMKFRTNPAIPEHLIHLSIDRNIVQLSGFVSTYQQADLAVLSARSTPGVKDVINDLIVLSDPDYAKRRGVVEEYSTKR